MPFQIFESVPMDDDSSEPGLEQPPTGAPLARLSLLEEGRRIELDLAAIDWLSGAGHSVRIHAGGEAHDYPLTLSALESRLDPGPFVRIHRSTIVNIEKVVALHADDSGAAEVELADGTRLPVTRSRKRLEEHLATRRHDEPGSPVS